MADTEPVLTGKKLGLLIARPPSDPAFGRALDLAAAALASGLTVYVYCLDAAVEGLDDPRLTGLRNQGLVLYACAYGARKRGIPLANQALFAGLTVLHDLMTGTDRFVSF